MPKHTGTVWFLGIDPGKKGGICRLSVLRPPRELVVATPMPSTERDVFDTIAGYDCSRTVAVIEHASSSPQMGVSSAFSYGAEYARLRMALIALRIPFAAVRPQVWIRVLSISPRKKTENHPQWKNRLRGKAQQLFPELPLWTKPGTKGIQLAVCDALLIAYYCRQVNQGSK